MLGSNEYLLKKKGNAQRNRNEISTVCVRVFEASSNIFIYKVSTKEYKMSLKIVEFDYIFKRNRNFKLDSSF